MAASMLPSIAFANANKYDDLIKEASRAYDVPYFLIKGLIAKESSFRPDAKAKTTSATGLMQLTRGAAQDAGTSYESLTDPYSNIQAGTLYLAMQYKRFGNWTDALAAYYAGGGTINSAKRNKANGEPISALAEAGYKYARGVYLYAAAFAFDLGEWV